MIQDWGTDGIREYHMARLPGSDVWYLTRLMRSDTRTTYQLSPSSSMDRAERAPYQLDPLNPRTFTVFRSEKGPDIVFSLLELPQAPAQPWHRPHPYQPGIVQLHTPWADQRRLWVYRPSQRFATPLPVMVVLDGRLYKDVLNLPNLLDYMIGRGELPPIVALLVDNPDRSELLCQPAFADYLTERVMPWLRTAYPISDDPRQTLAMGSSLGGLAATYLACRHPHAWGNVLSQSGWFRWHPEGDPESNWLARHLAKQPKADVRIWLQVGNLERARMLDGSPCPLEANATLRETLRAKAYDVSYQEYSGGHDASSLEYPLAAALTQILTDPAQGSSG